MDVEKLRELREFVEDYEADGCFCGVFRGCEGTGCRYGLHATVARALLARLEKLERVAEAAKCEWYGQSGVDVDLWCKNDPGDVGRKWCATCAALADLDGGKG